MIQSIYFNTVKLIQVLEMNEVYGEKKIEHILSIVLQQASYSFCLPSFDIHVITLCLCIIGKEPKQKEK